MLDYSRTHLLYNTLHSTASRSKFEKEAVNETEMCRPWSQAILDRKVSGSYN